MLDLAKLYLVPACIGIAFFIGIWVLLDVFIPGLNGPGVIAALFGTAIFGSFARKNILEDKVKGHPH